MTLNILEAWDGDVTDDEPTAAEVESWQREHLFIPAEDTDAQSYPRMTNLSAGLMYRAVVRPQRPEAPEYIAIAMDDGSLELANVVSRWNLPWEAAQFRRRFFDTEELPDRLAKLADLGDVNLILVPRTTSRYYEYAPLLHLLPRRTLEHFGLPLLRAGQWPFLVEGTRVDKYLPADFEQRLARAWAWQVWPHLNSGSPLSAFTTDDPIRILAHNLDFWVPPVTAAMQRILGEFPQVDNGVATEPVELVDGSLLEGAVGGNPRMGGDIWRGEEAAEEVMADTIEEGDSTGRLRGILDAVRSNRLDDDFSERWSFAREDFERKLYNKRSKVKVRFVELTDTIAVQGPESQVIGNIVTNDFMAVLDEQQRQIVVLLNSGWTKQHEIAEILGFANHSPVSKRLTQIRRQAEAFFAE